MEHEFSDLMRAHDLSPSTKRMVALDVLAPRYGFILTRGMWIKQWPSGKQWYMDQCGEYCGIYDQHGRIIRSSTRGDPITCIGMLAECSRIK